MGVFSAFARLNFSSSSLFRRSFGAKMDDRGQPSNLLHRAFAYAGLIHSGESFLALFPSFETR